jgi:hypothetical protein
LSREELRALLETHQDGWQASVWRLGMFDWRAAASVAALTAEAPASEPEPPAYVAPSSPAAAKPDRTSEWDAVATSELSAINRSELRALSERAPETGEWDAVGTSELRAIGTSELRVLATRQPSAPATISELRAAKPHELLRESVLPTVVISAETSSELPSFSWRAERDASSAPSPAREMVTPTPRGLRVPKPLPASRPPSRAPLFVMAGLVALSALALATALTLRWLRAHEPRTSQERAYSRAPLPPLRKEPTPDPVTAPAMLALPVAEARPPKRTRQVERGPHTRSASRVSSVRVSTASAKVRAGNDAEAQVVCTLPQGTVRPVLTEMTRMGARWFAVRCNAQAVGWVHESDLAPLER